eukprot:1159605-Pelagomonas_calceolata.AAC.8
MRRVGLSMVGLIFCIFGLQASVLAQGGQDSSCSCDSLREQLASSQSNKYPQAALAPLRLMHVHACVLMQAQLGQKSNELRAVQLQLWERMKELSQKTSELSQKAQELSQKKLELQVGVAGMLDADALLMSLSDSNAARQLRENLHHAESHFQPACADQHSGPFNNLFPLFYMQRAQQASQDLSLAAVASALSRGLKNKSQSLQGEVLLIFEVGHISFALLGKLNKSGLWGLSVQVG